MDAAKRTERSVDSLQKIYTVVIGLAIGVAIQSIAFARGDASGLTSAGGLLAVLPAAAAFLVTLVPFYHGMNRHLDVCYVERPEVERVKGALLLDFFVFLIETGLFYVVAASLPIALVPFLWIGILLTVDLLWAVVSHMINYRKLAPSTISWAMINLVAVVCGVFVYTTSYWSDNTKPWLLLMVLVVRTITDYKVCWTYYFPGE